jgi:gamma-glutamylcyclotransferase (GGCT)/AIG2-like uncharacterized protein YtfP
MLYFAYGANTNIESMDMRCPDANLIGAIALPNWKLVFKSVADIELSPNKMVHGVLWDITDDCERSLDYFEGFPHLYRKEYFEVKLKVNGIEKVETVMFYKMNRSEYYPPSDFYFRTIEEGYIQNKICTDLLYDSLNDVLMT